MTDTKLTKSAGEFHVASVLSRQFGAKFGSSPHPGHRTNTVTRLAWPEFVRRLTFFTLLPNALQPSGSLKDFAEDLRHERQYLLRVS